MASGSNARQERREKAAALRAVEQAKDRRRSLTLWVSLGAVIAVIAIAITFVVVRDQSNRPSLAAVKTYAVTANHVTTSVTYEQTPPVGGDHDPVWLNCGIYDAPVRNENAVHSLEHGAVWITYRPDLPEDQVAQLRDLTPDTYALLSPYEGISAPVVISAWGKQLELTGVDDPRLPAFIKEYRLGPQTPEPGAACTGGTDGVTSAPGMSK